MTTMDRWLAAACAELDLDAAEVDVSLVLDLARDVAHHVLRPGAPVTAYLLGIAVGRGADPATAAADLARLATAWPQNPPTATAPTAAVPIAPGDAAPTAAAPVAPGDAAQADG